MVGVAVVLVGENTNVNSEKGTRRVVYNSSNHSFWDCFLLDDVTGQFTQRLWPRIILRWHHCVVCHNNCLRYA
jgi:hypothetical protein